MLTKKQKNLLLFINKKLRSSGVSPSYEEMKESLNLKSKSGIHRLISALEERGFIKRLAHKARALEVIKLPETASANDIYNSFSPSVIKGGLDDEKPMSDDVEVPVLGKIAAGTPVEAIQNEVSRIPLPANLEKKGDYFGLKVQGDSMIEAGINEGDTPELLNFLLINKSKFFCFFVSIRTNIVQNLFYKSSLKFTIVKKAVNKGIIWLKNWKNRIIF